MYSNRSLGGSTGACREISETLPWKQKRGSNLSTKGRGCSGPDHFPGRKDSGADARGNGNHRKPGNFLPGCKRQKSQSGSLCGAVIRKRAGDSGKRGRYVQSTGNTWNCICLWWNSPKPLCLWNPSGMYCRRTFRYSYGQWIKSYTNAYWNHAGCQLESAACGGTL